MKERTECGSVLVGVMALFLALSILSLTVVHAMSAETRSTANRAASTQALALADAGVEYIYTRLKAERVRPQHVESEAHFSYPSQIDDWRSISGTTQIAITWDGGRSIAVSSTGTIHQPRARRRVILNMSWDPHPAFQYALATFGDDSSITIGGAVKLEGNVHSNGDAEAIWVEGMPPQIDGSASAVGEIHDPHHHFNSTAEVDSLEPPDLDEIESWIDAAKDNDAYEFFSTLEIQGGHEEDFTGIDVVEVEDGLRFAGGAIVKGYPLFIVRRGNIEIEGAAHVEGYFLLIGDGEVSISGTQKEETKLIGTVSSLSGNIEFKGNVSMIQDPPCEVQHEAVYGWIRGAWYESGPDT